MMFRNIFILLFLHIACAQDAPIVNTTQGPVRGLIDEDGNYMYLGIPYGVVDPANPFGLASPAPASEGTFNAVDDSAMCPQYSNGFAFGSLDCLHLSVVVPPSNGSLLPVLVFIHGGAFEVGFYGRQLYGVKFLVRHDIITVTLNYRLGVYGFMCTDNPRIPGNQGLKDQLLALRWVHNNIQNFGGDPNRVTLSGNSAGGSCADMQVLRNSNGENLFQQLILQSGTALVPGVPALRDFPLTLAQHFGLATNDMDEAIDFISTINPPRVMEAARHLATFQFRPCIERTFEGIEPFITENWVSMDVIPTAKDLNIMIGFNQNEALGLLLWPDTDLFDVVNMSLGEVFDMEHEDFTGIDAVKTFFFADAEVEDYVLEDAIDLMSDISFVHTSIRSIDTYLKNNVTKAYLYVFSYDGDRNWLKLTLNTTVEGAVHGDDMGYLYDVPALGTPTARDQRKIDEMTTMWTNFVKYGDPTPELTTLLPVKWEAITPSQYHYLRIDAELEAGTRPFQERIAFWDMFYELNGHLQRFLLFNS